MKIVVIGGTGLIGSKLVTKLNDAGHEAISASPRLGIDTITGEGLDAALEGASAVVDVSNSPNFQHAVAMEFFQTSTAHLVAAEAKAGVGHHVALSVVGTSTLAKNGDPETTTAGYFQAKRTQEELIAASGIPYTIVHATQFFEFVKGIADGAKSDGNAVHLPSVAFQPMAADDVAAALARISVGAPANGIVEIGGPESFRLDELIRRGLRELGDPREVVTDPSAGYFGITVSERTLVPGDGATLGETRFEDWLAAQPTPAAAG